MTGTRATKKTTKSEIARVGAFGGADSVKTLHEPFVSFAEDWARQALNYGVDAWERWVLFLDILRQRGDIYFEHQADEVPNVLNFQFELVMSGRELARPVNYGLVRILAPPGVTIDPKRRPFIVFDPRAGHGPGIGGMKHDSEIGVALAAGHACYFVGFVPHPVPDQTVEDVCRAEAIFVEKVSELHPEAEGKPCLIGNCQAGWQIMMMSATRPDLVGPVMLAGSPLSYWAGIRGKNPMRYVGGLLGGTWLTSLAGDLGNGVFDGAYLIANFEALNPANTYWEKGYNVFSKADTEGPRFLEFERWWGSPVLLNAAEMQFIADELFVGNRLASGQIHTSDGVRIDLRNIRSPIIVFCSFGDNITPPQQALGWILDLYGHEDDIIANGQTIIYALHQTVGHLGIFVSAKVATREHQEFTEAMDLIDVLPPGLYEAVITEKSPDTARPDLVSGNYLLSFAPRTLGHIRALGGNDAEDDRRFATVARVSEINQSLYRTFLSPIIRASASQQSAEWLQGIQPQRMRYEMFSDRNPFLRPIAATAKAVRETRRPAGGDNPFIGIEHLVSRSIADALDSYRDARDRFAEVLFTTVYGSPFLQAAVGLRADAAKTSPRIGRDLARDAAAAEAESELQTLAETGGLSEATMRAMLYIGLGHDIPAVDERSFAVLRQIRAHTPEQQRLSLPQFKEMVRNQYLLLRRDEMRAMAAIPKLLPTDERQRSQALNTIRLVASARGDKSAAVEERLALVEALFTGGGERSPVVPREAEWKVAAAESRAPTRRRRNTKASQAAKVTMRTAK